MYTAYGIARGGIGGCFPLARMSCYTSSQYDAAYFWKCCLRNRSLFGLLVGDICMAKSHASSNRRKLPTALLVPPAHYWLVGVSMLFCYSRSRYTLFRTKLVKVVRFLYQPCTAKQVHVECVFASFKMSTCDVQMTGQRFNDNFQKCPNLVNSIAVCWTTEMGSNK